MTKDKEYLDSDDRTVWEAVAKTVTRSLSEKPVQAEKSKPKPSKSRAQPQQRQQQTPSPPFEKPARGDDIDRRTEQRLKAGKIPIDEIIDLHGLTQDTAHRLLARRAVNGQKSGKRLILVITGKGIRSGGEGGVLKQALPIWCDLPPLADIVLKILPARPQHGGSGAYYLYLRRLRVKE